MPKKIVLGPAISRGGASQALESLKEILEKDGVICEICPSRDGLDSLLPGCEMVIPLGGDGTILHAARAAAPFGIPVLGINFGNKGFIADLERSEIDAVRRTVSGEYRIEERMMLDASVVRDGEVIHSDFALNEIVVGGVARAIDVSVWGDGNMMTSFSGDGIVVATPTGSTAYSLSAGGPIVEPEAECIVVTPICAHMLMAKTFVLASERKISVHLGSLVGKRAYLSTDGCEPVDLCSGDQIEITKSSLITKLVRVNDESFYRKVSRKLGENR